MAERSASLQLTSVSSNHCVATYGHVLLLQFGDEITLAALTVARKVHGKLAVRHPEGIGCLTVVEKPRASEPTLREAARLTRDTAERVRWSACVITSDGFFASAARAGLTTILTLSGQTKHVRAFAGVDQAAAWQEAHASRLGVPAGELVTAMERVRLAMQNHVAD